MSSRLKQAGSSPAALSTTELIETVLHQVGRLAKTHVDLAMTELRADVHAEIGAAKGLGIAAIAGIAALNLLLVSGVMALAAVMPAWAAGLVVSAAVVIAAVIAGAMGWGRRVRTPLARTRREIREDVRWTKE